MTPSEEDGQLFADCFAKNGTPRDASAVRWQFIRNPTGQLWVQLALADSGGQKSLAAIYAVLPVRMRYRGSVTVAAQSVDTITDAAFRGRGLFGTLAESCYAQAAAGGAEFVYGFPNANSAPGFFGRLKWVSVGPVPFLIRPLRTGYVLRRAGMTRVGRWVPDLPLPVVPRALPRGQSFAPVTRWDGAGDVWKDFSRTVGVAVERDAQYLSWRLSRPDARYQTLGAFEGDRLVAFAVWQIADKHEGRIGYVVELLHRRESRQSAAALLAHALANMQASGVDVVLAWNLSHSPNRRAFTTAGFLPFPERLRPIELHFGVRHLASQGDDLERARPNWYLSYCDSDTV